MNREVSNLPASIRQRLLNLSHATGVDFQLVLIRFALERLLYRLASSPHADRFVLKGALLFSLWEGWTPRPTRDLDLLWLRHSSEPDLAVIFRELCLLEVELDGLTFDPDSLVITDIRENQDAAAKRVRLVAMLAGARIDVQVDVAAGDAPLLPDERAEFPTMLDLPRPRLRVYSREAVVAEKYQAMVALGMANSRMKDFYDLWTLSRRFSFEGSLLARAIQVTFGQRRTKPPVVTPLALTAEFSRSSDKVRQWRGFIRRLAPRDAVPELEEIVRELAAFLEPVRSALAADRPFVGRWDPGAGWLAGETERRAVVGHGGIEPPTS